MYQNIDTKAKTKIQRQKDTKKKIKKIGIAKTKVASS